MRLRALHRLAGIVVPPRCAACERDCPASVALCDRCRSELDRSPALIEAGPPGIELSISAAEYSGAAQEITRSLKFGRRLTLARVAAEAIVRACPADRIRGSVVPVPAAPLRWRWRGFDPAEEIALSLASLTGLPFSACLRRRSGPRQVGRPRSRRLAEPPRVRLRGRAPEEALLVDDVRTTGATLVACARALRAAGCSQIVALTFAHSR